MRRKHEKVIIGTGFMLLLFGCVAPTPAPIPTASPQAAPSPAPALLSPTAPATQMEQVRIVNGPVALMTQLPLDVAQALDLYKQEGLDVTVQHLGGVEATNALGSDSVDFISNDPPIAAQAQGKALQMVVAFSRFPGVTLIVRGDLKDKIKTVADLKGQKVGVPGSPGTFGHTLLQYLIVKAGLGSEDVQVVSGGSPLNVNTAMAAGSIAAAISYDPYTTQVIQQGKAYALIDLASEADGVKYLGGDYQTGMLTTVNLIKNRPKLVQKMTNAVVKALRYMASHSAAEIASILPDSVTGKDKAVYVAALQHSLAAFSKDGQLTEAGIKNWIEVNKVYGAIKSDQAIDTSALYTNGFIKNVK